MRRALLTAALVALAACRSGSLAPPPAIGGLHAAAKDGKGTAWLFDDQAPPRAFQLEVAPADWEWLRANATDEEYVPASVVFEGETYGGAAVRFKGAYGSLHACFDPTGAQTCAKLSIKVSFNEYYKDGRFFGVRKLVFNSCNRDATCLHERLAYALFRTAGLEAPRAVHALLSVNGEPAGLYVLVENVDREFLEDHFDDPSGNLYKEAWPRSQDPEFYAAKLKTNEDEADVSHLVAFATAMEDADDVTFNEVVDAFMDRESMLRYLSVDQMVNNWDGVTKLYCTPAGQCMNHNFYLYDDPASGRFVVIPWDLDHTFNAPNEDLARSWWTDAPGTCEIAQANALVSVLAPQCDPLLRGLLLDNWGAYVAQVEAYTAPGALLSVETQQELLDRYRVMILAAVENDPHGPGPSGWRMATAQLREVIAAQHAAGMALVAEEGPP